MTQEQAKKELLEKTARRDVTKYELIYLLTLLDVDEPEKYFKEEL